MKTKRIVLAGGSGFIGKMLANRFAEEGYDVVVLTRSPKAQNAVAREVEWTGNTLGDWREELEGAHALINLAGRSVNCRYHSRNRKAIMDSRVESTQILGEAVRSCRVPPPVWLNSSTATIYKHSLDRPMDEDGQIAATAEAKDQFSVEVANAWEKAFNSIPTPNTRKLLLRSAMVLGRGSNSVFPALRNLARYGLGGRMGSGNQFVSWIHESDFFEAIVWLIENDTFGGVVNLAAPNPIPNCEVMEIFRRVCGLPFGLPTPLWMLEIGAFFLRTETELVIKSRRVIPKRLEDAGFTFRFREMAEAVRALETEIRNGLSALGPR